MKVGAGNSSPGCGVSLAVLLTAFMSVAVLEAGAGQVELSGIVLDPSGHSISDAAIVLVSSTTGVSRKVGSDKSGQYQFPDLPAGTYLLKVSYPGFAPHSQKVTLENSELRNLDVVLQLAARRESVTVTTRAAGAFTPMGEASAASRPKIRSAALTPRNSWAMRRA